MGDADSGACSRIDASLRKAQPEADAQLSDAYFRSRASVTTQQRRPPCGARPLHIPMATEQWRLARRNRADGLKSKRREGRAQGCSRMEAVVTHQLRDLETNLSWQVTKREAGAAPRAGSRGHQTRLADLLCVCAVVHRKRLSVSSLPTGGFSTLAPRGLILVDLRLQIYWTYLPSFLPGSSTTWPPRRYARS